MLSFVDFVLTFVNENTPAGDLARDMADDITIDNGWGFESLRFHLESHNACSAAIDIMEEIHLAYGDFYKQQSS